MKKLLIIICFLSCLCGCGHKEIPDNELQGKELYGNDTIDLSPTKISPESTITQDAASDTEGWSPNHGNVSITVKETGTYDDQEEYLFISRTVGWKAHISPIGAGQDRMILYQTNDGGLHWKQIADSTDPSLSITGGFIEFINSKTGWIIRPFPMDGGTILYRTQDGGKTWVTQKIVPPMQYRDKAFSIGLPVFFSQTDGIMFSSCKDYDDEKNQTDTVVFITHDGGDTWIMNTKADKDDKFEWSIHKKGNSLKIIYNKKIWKSTDGIVWKN